MCMKVAANLPYWNVRIIHTGSLLGGCRSAWGRISFDANSQTGKRTINSVNGLNPVDNEAPDLIHVGT